MNSIFAPMNINQLIVRMCLSLLIFSLFGGCKDMPDSPLVADDLGHELAGQPGIYSILSVNVGNSDITCGRFAYKLCHQAVRDRIRSNIQKLQPDFILLQELLGSWQCSQEQLSDPSSICYQLDETTQARQLVGENYSIVVNDRNQHEAIAIRSDRGVIVGCRPGGDGVARTAPPLAACNDGFTVMAATIRLHSGLTFDLVNAHPNSRDVRCRELMLDQIFSPDSSTSLIQQEKALISGDFNLDPWRGDDQSVITWRRFFDEGWMGRDFTYHSGIAEIQPPRYTFRFLVLRRTLDFMVSNFAQGTVYVLGETPRTHRLDGGAGMDHRALFGWLQLEPTETGE